jgi:hypothetical protein
MISIKILECSNSNLIGNTVFYSNLIEIGSTNGDILLQSKDYMNHLFYVETVEDYIQIIPNPNIDFYLLNGKRSLSQRKLQKSDTITYNDFVFSVIDFSYTEMINYDDIISKKFNDLNEEEDLHKLLVKLDQELLEIEDASN